MAPLDVLDLKAIYITFAINTDFSLKYIKETVTFYFITNQEILIKPMERLCVYIDLFIVFNRPLIIHDLFENHNYVCCFHEVLRNGNMTFIEKLEFLNVHKEPQWLKKGDNLFSFKSVGLFQIPVILIEEAQASLKQRWLDDSDRR